MKDNKCDNALDLTNGQLIVQDDWPDGTSCLWLISAEEDDDYVTIEFLNMHVNISLALKEQYNCINNNLSKLF